MTISLPSAAGIAQGGGGSIADSGPLSARPGVESYPPYTRLHVGHPFNADTIAFLTARDLPEWIEKKGAFHSDGNAYWTVGKVPFQVVAGELWPGFKQGAANGAFPWVGGGGFMATDQWAFEIPILIAGVDLSTLGTVVFLGVTSGVQALVVQKTGTTIAATVSLDTRAWVAGGAIVSNTAQFTLANGDVPADTWKRLYVSYDGTNMRVGLGDDTKSGTVAVTVPFIPWDGQGRAAGKVSLCAQTYGSAQVPELTVGATAILRYARNPTTQTTPVRRAIPKITIDAGSIVRSHDFLAGVVDHYYGFTVDETDTHATERDAQLDMLTAAGCQIVRHAECTKLAPPTMTGGPTGTIASIDFTKMNAHYDRWGDMPIHLSAFLTPQALRTNPGDLQTAPPASNTVYATWVSQVVTHIKARYPGQLRSVALWNEPVFSGFYSGTRAQLVALWAAIATRMVADHPDIPFGNIDGIPSATADSGIDDIHTMNSIIAKAQTDGRAMPFTAIHHYESDLALLRDETDHLRSLASTAGFANHKIIVSEWSFDSGAGGQENAQSLSRGFSDRDAFRIRGGASAYQMLSHMASDSRFLSSQYYGFSHDEGNGIAYGFIDDSLVHPRPFPAFVAHQLFWKHEGDIITNTPNWPGVRSFATVADDGRIMVSYGMYRGYEPLRETEIRFDWTNLPASFTWKRWHFAQGDQADGRLVKVGAGTQANLPLGVALDGACFGGIEITP